MCQLCVRPRDGAILIFYRAILLFLPMQYFALARGNFTGLWGYSELLIRIQSGPCEIFTSLTYLVFCCKIGHFYEFNDPVNWIFLSWNQLMFCIPLQRLLRSPSCELINPIGGVTVSWCQFRVCWNPEIATKGNLTDTSNTPGLNYGNNYVFSCIVSTLLHFPRFGMF